MTKAYESGNGMRYEPGDGINTAIFGYNESVGVHTYNATNSGPHFAAIPHEEFVKMINSLPGYKATYTPPRRKNVDVVRDLPSGSIFKWPGNNTSLYVRREGEGLGSVIDVVHGQRHYVSSFNHSESTPIVVIYNPEEGSE